MRLTAVKTAKIRRDINELGIMRVAVLREGKGGASILDNAALTAVKTEENNRPINPLASKGGW